MNKRRSDRKSWLVSFGDLLTLLLCLFIARYEVINDKSGVTSRIQEQMRPLKVSNKGGTHIANSKVRISPREVRFHHEDFDPVTGELMGIARERLNLNGIPESYHVKSVHLVLCTGAQDDVAETRAKQRAVAIRRQLLDTGYPIRELDFEIYGPGCPKSTKGERKDLEGIAQFTLTKM